MYYKKETFYVVEFTEADYGYILNTLINGKKLNPRQLDILQIEFENAKKIKREADF